MTVEEIFGPGGPLAAAMPGFEARPGQVQMAQLIERGFLEQVHTLVEAGTGVGKSLAYLVPALRSGARVVISTGTIALQEQLVRKDIPLVTRALGVDLRVTLLKGRSHYLCRAKYERLSGERLVAGSAGMERLWRWAERTETGDRAELEHVPAPGDWEQLDADADDCTGEHCPRFADCHYFRVREQARLADIVVVNHALFFLDLVVGGGLLPAYDLVVLDEAHQAERYATAALTATLSARETARLLRRLRRHYALPSTYDAEVDEAMRRLDEVLGRVREERYPVAANDAVPDALPAVREALYRLENWLHVHGRDGLRREPSSDEEADRRRELALRAVAAHVATVDRVQIAAAQAASGAIPSHELEAVAWVERTEDGRRELHAAPFEVASFLRGTLFGRVRSCVLTSATIADGLTVDGTRFGFLRETLGVAEAQELVAASPFDYRRQARLYLAGPQLNPKSNDFARRAAPIVEECLDRTGGRAFVLFTSYARLRELHGLLRDRIPFPTKMQGELPRHALLEWFRTTPRAVLFATGTFWEGIDVVGDALSCVIIDRLPFPSPAEPLVAARLAALEARGRPSFEAYMVPAAITKLKQGFGRLIRSRTDRGLVALLDGRAVGMRYGATIVDALPPATRIDDLSLLDELFREDLT